MKKLVFYLLIPAVWILMAVSLRKTGTQDHSGALVKKDTLQYPEERHFRNMQQLTFGGTNAEAYFSYDGKWLIFQRTNIKEGIPCDQMFIGKLPKNPGEAFTYKMISNGKGRTTCGFFMPDGKHIIYASTFLSGDSCPPVPDREKMKRYIWPVYAGYDIFMADLDGKIVKQLTTSAGYDAEATLSPDGSQMLFTSDRDGDLDLYSMDMHNFKVKRITNTLGYDGGAWFSPDGKKIIWRASRPETPEAIEDYKNLLRQGLVAPTQMEVWMANADGSESRQITHYGQANWAPNFIPGTEKIIFCSNYEYARGFPFNMYTLNPDGTGLEKISRDNGFDAFPMFSPGGDKIVFSSNRNGREPHEINIFVADWVK
jgi:TolB protein